MGESVKVFCCLILMVGSIAALLAWSVDPDQTVWTVRIVSTVASIGSLGLILFLQFRRDQTPDYLYTTVGEYRNNSGFSVGLTADEIGGVCHLLLYFQNQHEGRSVARVTLEPSVGVATKGNSMDTIECKVACKPAAFGVVRIPIAVPKLARGRVASFEVQTSVKYPDGKGKRVRFRDGTRGNFFQVRLPSRAAEEIPQDLEMKVSTLWKLGDSALDLESVGNDVS